MASTRNTTLSIHNRQFWTEFFVLYESLPALWNVRSDLYKERAAKIAAYDLMVEKLREIEPTADREDVLRKINIFRTNFRREISRINMSNKMGKQYKTTLWYFDLLSFLKTQEPRRDRRHLAEKCIMPKRRLTGLGSAFSVKKQRVEDTTTRPKIANLEYEEDSNYEYEDEEHGGVAIESIPSSTTPTQSKFQSDFQTYGIGIGIESKNPLVPKMEQRQQQQHGHDDDDDPYVEEEDEIEMIHDDGSAEEQQCIVLSDPDTMAEWPDLENPEAGTMAMAMEQQQQQQQEAPQSTYDHESSRKTKTTTTTTTATAATMEMSGTNMQKFQLQTSPKQQRGNKWKTTSEASDILAKSWAIQYEEMTPDQKIYARKAIADILFEGCMGNLGRDRVAGSRPEQSRQQVLVHEVAAPVSGDENEAPGGGEGVVVNGRSLLKPQQQQHLTQPFNDVVNDFEQCYVFDDGRAVKLQDWAVRLK